MVSALLEVAKLLESLGIAYCLIGGYAVAVHGVPRHTADLDLLVELSDDELARLFEELERRRIRYQYRRSSLNDPVGDMLSLDLVELPVQLIRAKWKHESSAIARAIEIAYHGAPIRVAAAEDLIVLKLRAGGPLDLYDVENILASKGAGLDYDLLENLAREHRVWRKLAPLLRRRKP
jgi:predicted nucleotidyltransferase